MKTTVVSVLLYACFVMSGISRIANGDDTRCHEPADIFFVLDASSSIWGPDFKKQLAFMNTVISELDPSVVRCGLLTYGNDVRVEFGLNSYAGQIESLAAAVSSVRQLRGDTRTDKALQSMRRLLLDQARDGVPRIAIVITDGQSDHPKLTKHEAEVTHRSGITTFAIGIGQRVDANELRGIASHDDFLFTVDSFDALSAIKAMLKAKACTVKFAPRPYQIGSQDIGGCRYEPTDIVLMLDTSSKVQPYDFTRLLKFSRELVGVLPLSSGEVRVGLITYGRGVRQQFELGDYDSTDEVVRAIYGIEQLGGGSNTADALRFLRQHSFAGSRGRKDAHKVAIVITNGLSQSPRTTVHQAQLVHNSDIRVFAVGVGSRVDPGELMEIASRPDDQHLVTVPSYDDLDSVKTFLVGKICRLGGGEVAEHQRPEEIVWTGKQKQHTTEPITTATPTPTTTTATPTTPTTPAPRGCGNVYPADIVFALPSNANFYQTREVLEFIRSAADRMTISSSAVRIGLVPRECVALPGFSLDQGSSKRNVLRIFGSYHKTAMPETASSIRYLRTVSFNREHGARDNARKIGVLVIDKPLKDFSQAVDEAIQAKADNVELLVVGVGSEVSTEELTILASQNTKVTVMQVATYSNLRQLTKRLISNINQHCLGYRGQ